MRLSRFQIPAVIALAIASISGSAQAIPDAPVRPAAKNARFYCPGAAGKPTTCTPQLATSASSTIAIQVLNHANGGEACRLSGKQGWLTGTHYINPGDNRPKTFGKNFPAGTGFVLQSMRRYGSGDAGIGGYVYYR